MLEIEQWPATRRILTGLAIAASVAACRSGAPSGGDPPLGTTAPGTEAPRPVGFTVRGTAGARVWVWYPAAVPKQGRFALGEYLIAPFDAVANDRGAFGFRRMVRENATVTDEQFSRLLATDLPVSRDPPAASGPFPLVLLGTGLNAPGYLLTEVAEFLAGQGYVVAGAPSHAAVEGERLSFDTAGVGTQVATMEKVRGIAAAFPGVDTNRIGVVGWSVGGVAGVTFAARRPGVRALVSLDSGVEYRYGDSLLVAMGVAVECLAIPRLHLIAGGPPRFEVPRSRRLFDSPSLGDAYRLVIPELIHSEFTSPYGLRGAVHYDAARRRVQRGQSRAFQALAVFLDRYLVANPNSKPMDDLGLARRAADPNVACSAAFQRAGRFPQGGR